MEVKLISGTLTTSACSVEFHTMMFPSSGGTIQLQMLY